jgi:multiple sugar transport system ATP-binding protein
MADTLAVTNAGVLQRYDSRVFAHPMNKFVAVFVDSPAMSLVNVKVVATPDGAALQGDGGWRWQLSQAKARALSATGFHHPLCTA